MCKQHIYIYIYFDCVAYLQWLDHAHGFVLCWMRLHNGQRVRFGIIRSNKKKGNALYTQARRGSAICLIATGRQHNIRTCIVYSHQFIKQQFRLQSYNQHWLIPPQNDYHVHAHALA